MQIKKSSEPVKRATAHDPKRWSAALRALPYFGVRDPGACAPGFMLSPVSRALLSYSGHPWLADDIKERGIDEMSPIWNVLDLTPQGRGTFYTSLDYGTKVQIAKR